MILSYRLVSIIDIFKFYKVGEFMDINTIRIIRNTMRTKENENSKINDKKQGKKIDVKGCLKLVDYTSF